MSRETFNGHALNLRGALTLERRTTKVFDPLIKANSYALLKSSTSRLKAAESFSSHTALAVSLSKRYHAAHCLPQSTLTGGRPQSSQTAPPTFTFFITVTYSRPPSLSYFLGPHTKYQTSHLGASRLKDLRARIPRQIVVTSII